jgi:transcriptional regulator with XRE-family HTH domain
MLHFVSMTLIEQLRLLRVKANVSQEQMALKLKITRQGYSHLESGSRRIRLEQAVNAFEELGFQLQAIESPIEDQVREFSVTRLAKYLYRRVIAGDSMHLQNLQDISSLSDNDFDEVGRFVRLYLDNPGLRSQLVAIVVAVANSNNE